jgi:CubicO group peptidase (beta-lactamase class C family)
LGRILLLLAIPAGAADLSLIDAYVRAEMELNSVPGASVAVVRKGEIVYARGFGVRNTATDEPMSAGTPVDLASVSKPLTAVAIAQLEKNGSIDRDAPVTRYLPELGGAFSAVTVSHLLRHKSGLTRSDDFLAPCCGRPGEFDLDAATARLAAAKPRPDAAFAYANSNYVLLAAVAQRVSGQPFPAVLRDLVFLPSGMQRSTLDAGQARQWGLAEPHERRWGQVEPSRSPFLGWHGSSLVKSTAEDMARYLLSVLKSDTAAWREPYDWGWFIRYRQEWTGKPRVLEHGGDTWGGNTAVVVAPSWDMGAVVLLNIGAHRALEIARGVLALTAGLPAPPPRRASVLSDTDAWAILFAISGTLMTVAAAVLAWRARAAWRCGKRRWLVQPARAFRAVLLLAMAAYLLFALANRATLPLDALPESLRAGLRLLLASTAAILVMVAVLGLAPRAQPARERLFSEADCAPLTRKTD